MTIFPILYISYPWLISFATGSLYLLISLTYFLPILWQTPDCSLYLELCFCVLHLFVLFFRFKACSICLSLSDSGCRALGIPELVFWPAGGQARAQGVLGLVPTHWWVRLVLELMPAHWWAGPVPGPSGGQGQVPVWDSCGFKGS